MRVEVLARGLIQGLDALLILAKRAGPNDVIPCSAARGSALFDHRLESRCPGRKLAVRSQVCAVDT